MKLSPAQARLLRRISAGPVIKYRCDTAGSLIYRGFAEVIEQTGLQNLHGVRQLAITEVGRAALKDL